MTAIDIAADRPRTAGLSGLHRGTKLYDFLFGLPLIGWYGACFATQAPALLLELSALKLVHPDPLILIDVLAKAAMLLFAAVLIGFVIVRRPATSGAKGLLPKLVAFAATFLGVVMLSLPHHAVPWPVQIVSMLLIFGGVGFAIYALAWLGRSVSVMSEARKLVTGGPYALVRHPLYLGEETALVGMALQFLSPAALVILLTQMAFQLYRMQVEEQVMSDAFPDYAAYRTRVKRLIPGIY